MGGVWLAGFVLALFVTGMDGNNHDLKGRCLTGKRPWSNNLYLVHPVGLKNKTHLGGKGWYFPMGDYFLAGRDGVFWAGKYVLDGKGRSFPARRIIFFWMGRDGS